MQVTEFQADLRYVGQGLLLPVHFEVQNLATEGLTVLRQLFENGYESLFTYRLSSEVEVTNLRVIF